MQIKNLALTAAAVAGASAQATNMSICDKYTTALLKENTAANQYTLLTLLVNTAGIGNYTGPGTKNPTLPGSMVNVPGILAPAGGLVPYFSGALKSSNRNGMPTAVNFLDGGAPASIIANATSSGMPGSNTYTLFTHLYSYFGAALGCTHYSSMGFPAYAGVASQGAVHKYMDLNATQVNYFIEQVGLSAKSFGASDADVTTVGNLLTKVFNYKCAPAATVIPAQGAQLQSICQAASCPIAPNGTCSAYPGTAVMPMMSNGTAMDGNGSTVSIGSGSTGTSGTSGSMSSGSSTSGSAASGSGSGAAKSTSGADINAVTGWGVIGAVIAAFAL